MTWFGRILRIVAGGYDERTAAFDRKRIAREAAEEAIRLFVRDRIKTFEPKERVEIAEFLVELGEEVEDSVGNV